MTQRPGLAPGPRLPPPCRARAGAHGPLACLGGRSPSPPSLRVSGQGLAADGAYGFLCPCGPCDAPVGLVLHGVSCPPSRGALWARSCCWRLAEAGMRVCHPLRAPPPAVRLGDGCQQLAFLALGLGAAVGGAWLASGSSRGLAVGRGLLRSRAPRVCGWEQVPAPPWGRRPCIGTPQAGPALWREEGVR